MASHCAFCLHFSNNTSDTEQVFMCSSVIRIFGEVSVQAYVHLRNWAVGCFLTELPPTRAGQTQGRCRTAVLRVVSPDCGSPLRFHSHFFGRANFKHFEEAQCIYYLVFS